MLTIRGKAKELVWLLQYICLMFLFSTKKSQKGYVYGLLVNLYMYLEKNVAGFVIFGNSWYSKYLADIWQFGVNVFFIRQAPPYALVAISLSG